VAPFHIDGVFVDEGHAFGDEALFHDLRVAERPPSTEKSFAIDHAVKRQIEPGWRTGDGPPDLPRTSRIPQRSRNISVTGHSAIGNLSHYRKNQFGEAGLNWWAVVEVVHT
jgi:hypothetical protein